MVRPVLKSSLVLLFSITVLLAYAPAQAALQAFVDRNPVVEGKPFTLTLKSDEDLDGNPELSVLQQNFELLGQTKGSRLQIINGTSSRSIQWQITLMPKHNGPLLIPPIKVGGQVSLPVTIVVAKADQAQASPQSGELFLDVSAEPHTAYVQQQILFTARLYRKVSMGDGSTLSTPKFPDMDAQVERIGDDRSYQTTHNGQTYAVTERRYAVYPQKSGHFYSTPVQFDGDIVEGNRGGGFFTFDSFSQRSRHKRLFSKSIAFTIKPAPTVSGAPYWLPASKLQLSEQWSENPPKFIAGEPVTRTLTISASGLSASQLPALKTPAIEGVKFYPDQAILKDNKADNGSNGVRSQKVAILPTRAGNFTLPAIEVKWWNVNTDKLEVAQLPARSITVLPAATGSVSVNTLPSAAATITPAEPVEAKKSAAEILLATKPFKDKHHASGYWPWLSLFLGTGWLLTLVVWWWIVRSKRPPVKIESKGDESLKQVKNQLKKCCMANDAVMVKSKLLVWSKLRWQAVPPSNLTAMARLCPPDLAHELNELDRMLYSQGKEVWQGNRLWQLFNRDNPVAAAIHGKKMDSLKSLYPAAP